jgi:hypothetical protein
MFVVPCWVRTDLRQQTRVPRDFPDTIARKKRNTHRRDLVLDGVDWCTVDGLAFVVVTLWLRSSAQGRSLGFDEHAAPGRR